MLKVTLLPSQTVLLRGVTFGATGAPGLEIDTVSPTVMHPAEFLTASEQANYYYNSIRNRNMDLGNDVSGDPASWRSSYVASS